MTAQPPRSPRPSSPGRPGRVSALGPALALLAGVSLAACASEPPKLRPAEPQPIVAAQLPGFEVLNEVGEEVLLGGQPTPEGLSRARDAGVKVVVNLRPESEMSFEEKSVVNGLGMKYVSIGFTPATLTDRQVDAFLDVIRITPPDDRVLVHCSSGNRAAALWAIYEIADLGSTPEDAVGRARRLGLKSPELIGYIGDWSRRHGKM